MSPDFGTGLEGLSDDAVIEQHRKYTQQAQELEKSNKNSGLGLRCAAELAEAEIARRKNARSRLGLPLGFDSFRQ